MGTIQKRLGANGRAVPITYPRKRLDISAHVLRELAAECPSASEMARRLKTSHTTVFRKAREYKVPLPRGKYQPRGDTIVTVARIREQVGKPVADIAHALGCSRRTVYYHNERYGIGIPVKAGKFQGQRNKTRRSA